jgi:hypothetical protein
MLVAGDAHQADAITRVVLQGPGDAAAQIGPSGLAGSAVGSGAGSMAETLAPSSPSAAMTRYRIVWDDGLADTIAGQRS